MAGKNKILQSHFKVNLKSDVTGRLTVTRTGVEPVTPERCSGAAMAT
jgi:hypothetical protein